MLRRFYVIVFIGLCFLPSVAAPDLKEISGTVRSSDGEPLEFATVAVPGSTFGTTTDENGKFRFQIPDEKTRLQASFLGFISQTVSVGAETRNIDFVLDADMTRLREVVVTGTRTPRSLSDAPVITRVISASDIAKTDAGDISALLQAELPGVEFSYAMNQQVSLNMQGFGGTSVLFLMDGERMAGETLDNVDYSRLNTGDIERIEIVKGAASTLYGSNAAGGVINVITKKNREPITLDLSGRYGTQEGWKANLSASFQKGKWRNLATCQYTDQAGYKMPESTEGNNDFNEVFGNRAWNARDRIEFIAGNKLTFSANGGFFFRERNESDYLKSRYLDYDGGIKAEYKITEKDRLEAVYRIDCYDKGNFLSKRRQYNRTYRNLQNSLRVFYNRTFNPKHSLSAGADYMNDRLSSYQFADEGVYTQHTLDFFAQYEWHICKQAEMEAGLRGDWYSASGFHLSPKLSFRFRPHKAWNLRIGYANGFRAPTLKELYMRFDMANIFMIYGNPDLKSETTHNTSVSVEFAQPLFNITASGYYNFLENRITTAWDDDLEGMRYINTAQVGIVGADADLNLRLGCGFSARIGYAYTHEFVPKGRKNTSDTRPHCANLRLSYGKRINKNYSFDITLSARYNSAVEAYSLTGESLYREYSDQPTRYPGYMMGKIVFVQKFASFCSLTLTVDNLFNYKPKVYLYNTPPTLGTSFLAGLSFNLGNLIKKEP